MKSNRLGIAARQFKYDDKFADAAEAYAQQADIDLPDNELIYADECEYSFEMWMKAGNYERALEQARRALRGYTLGHWLKGENSYIDNLTEMVGEMRKADRVDEADAFLTDINNYLASIGEQPVVVTLSGKQRSFPDSCPHCGGEISYHGTLEEIECPFCNCVIHAL
ncbi:MAG TPA: hypothetical protein VL325_10335 [Pyrinomonadaceae bacterium]|nr:hypothetical protein [Pyrinomonadaceae bacterium]